MKKFVSIILCLLLLACTFAACSAEETAYESKSYTPENVKIEGINIDVRDRAIEIIAGEDEQIHIDYCESEKEFFDFSVSEDNILTVRTASDKDWKDFIGKGAPANARKITVRVPNGVLHSLSASTTNENISLAPLTLSGDVSLSANGGNITFEKLDIGNNITLNVKNGNISGAIFGSYDDYAISCDIKKGKSNLPASKESGSKKLKVSANNGDITIDIAH